MCNKDNQSASGFSLFLIIATMASAVDFFMRGCFDDAIAYWEKELIHNVDDTVVRG